MVAGRSCIARRGRFRHLLWRTPHDHHIYKEEDVRSRVPQLMAALGKRVPGQACLDRWPDSNHLASSKAEGRPHN